jgi:quinoprotein glucose dehydrogenase
MRLIRVSVAVVAAGAVGAVVVIGLLSGGVGAQGRRVASEWPSYAGTNWSQKYSPLEQINKENFKDLRVAWTWRSPDHELIKTLPPYPEMPYNASGMKATPLVVGGIMYVSTGMGQVAAIDPATGQTRWLYNPEAYKHGGQAVILGWMSRGVSYWTDGRNDERILFGTLDGYLIALDAKTGQPVKGFGNAGRVDLTREIPRATRNTLHLINGEQNYVSVTSPPTLVRDTVVVGSAISDRTPVREWSPGYVQAFDVRTGKLKWVFHTVPRDGEYGADTWKDHSNRYTGNVNVWSTMSGDDELGHVYLPLSTPTSDYWGGFRKGDNLFAESIVAVDVESGKRVWHFQAVHHGVWDYDFPCAPTLLDVTVNGRRIRALAQASKQGFLYVFDRTNGRPIWPIEERPVPPSDIPGEELSPTQPFPTKPPAFDVQGLSNNDLIDFTPELKEQALAIVKNYRYGPLFTPPSLYQEGGTRGTIQVPSDAGAASWSGSGADPDTGYVYVPSKTNVFMMTLTPLPPGLKAWPTVAPLDGTPLPYVPSGKIGPPSIHPARPQPPMGPQGLPLVKPPYSRMTAYNLNTGEIAWQVPTGAGREDIRQHRALKGLTLPPLGGQGGPGGPLVTKTLLMYGLIGSAPGAGSKLVAYDKMTGATLGEAALPAAVLGTPMTYAVNGKQYVSLALQGGQIAALTLP